MFFLLDQKEPKNQENPIRTFPAGHSLTPRIFWLAHGKCFAFTSWISEVDFLACFSA